MSGLKITTCLEKGEYLGALKIERLEAEDSALMEDLELRELN